MIFPAHYFVIYLVADHAFVNNHTLDRQTFKQFLGHLLWSFLVVLAFTFDTLLKTTEGTVIFLSFAGLHLLTDWIRWRFHRNKIVELANLVITFIYTLLFSSFLKRSYVSPEFSTYLLGMLIVTVGVTYLTRELTEPDRKDTVGISERLAIYIFAMAGRFEWVIISIIAGLVYRLIFEKRRDVTWWLSPLVGALLSFLWFWLV
ncbi:MAG: hypothetical protein PWP37_1423 [Thermotogota bacterium]|nr:hypothetical protein [Thermotogota bacterium]